jgi:hypothetical protein
MTCLEIDDQSIALVHYFDRRGQMRRMQDLAERVLELEGQPYCRRVVKQDRLEWIFARIKLLAGGGRGNKQARAVAIAASASEGCSSSEAD